jgi:hypothetical protein
MEKFTEWLTSSFTQRPLVLLFFIVGVVLVVVSLIEGIDVPGSQRVVVVDAYRNLALIIGLVCMIAAIPLDQMAKREKKSADGVRAREVDWDFSQKSLFISSAQRKLLEFIRHEALQVEATPRPVLRRQIQEKFPAYSGGELVYRLEQLRLLGFIEQDVNSEDGAFDLYRLSAAYRKALGSGLFSSERGGST